MALLLDQFLGNFSPFYSLIKQTISTRFNSKLFSFYKTTCTIYLDDHFNTNFRTNLTNKQKQYIQQLINKTKIKEHQKAIIEPNNTLDFKEAIAISKQLLTDFHLQISIIT